MAERFSRFISIDWPEWPLKCKFELIHCGYFDQQAGMIVIYVKVFDRQFLCSQKCELYEDLVYSVTLQTFARRQHWTLLDIVRVMIFPMFRADEI